MVSLLWEVIPIDVRASFLDDLGLEGNDCHGLYQWRYPVEVPLLEISIGPRMQVQPPIASTMEHRGSSRPHWRNITMSRCFDHVTAVALPICFGVNKWIPQYQWEYHHGPTCLAGSTSCIANRGWSVKLQGWWYPLIWRNYPPVN
jgi:hypothetical protein